MTREEYDVHEKVAHEYYEWLLTLVNQKKNGKYSRLLKLLHETEFIFITAFINNFGFLTHIELRSFHQINQTYKT